MHILVRIGKLLEKHICLGKLSKRRMHKLEHVVKKLKTS
jgi:hypothetical protein